MKQNIRRILAAFAILFVFTEVLPAQQQGLPVDGRDFYIGIVRPSFYANAPQLSDGDFHPFSGIYALISSYTQNTVTFSYFDDNGKEYTGQVFNLSAKRGQAVPLPWQDGAAMALGAATTGDSLQYKACHITSKKPINVQFFSTGSCSGGSYLALPTPALGKNYVIPSYYDNPANGGGQPYS